MVPKVLAGLGVEAVNDTGQLGGVNQAIVDRTGGQSTAKEIVAIAAGGGGAAVVPDESGVLVDRCRRIEVIVNRRHVALLGDIDAPKMPHALFVLRILADADVELVVMHNRRGNEVVACPLRSQDIEGFLGVAIKLPDEGAGRRLEGVDPTVAAGENNLAFAVHLGIDGARPLAVHQQLALVD